MQHIRRIIFLMAPMSHAVQPWQFVECAVACGTYGVQLIRRISFSNDLSCLMLISRGSLWNVR